MTFLSTKSGVDFDKIVQFFIEFTETYQLSFYKNLRMILAVSQYIGEELKEFSKEEIDSLSLNMNFLLIQEEISAAIAATTVIAASNAANN
ncbi:hypothetical protein IGI37_001568 [Enterococcus sp. AZ194]|uniref:hypothetical protein n=1 Tax=Enterococcus sp. AZ194 TaxID=2774629 RepID=UPI003F1EFFD2